MTNQEFYQWRKAMRLSRKKAAELLGVSTSTVQLYERGQRFDRDIAVQIPVAVALACAHLKGERDA